MIGLIILAHYVLYVSYVFFSRIDNPADLMQVFIGVSTLVIAIIQALYGIGKIREKHRIKETIDKLVKKIDKPRNEDTLRVLKNYEESYSGQIRRLNAYYEALTKQKLTIGLEPIKEYFQDLLKTYRNYIDSIEDLYKGLLEFEKEFSMSYGFGRYIDVFRVKLPEINRCYTETESALENKNIDDLKKAYEEMLEKISELDPFMRELDYKFSKS